MFIISNFPSLSHCLLPCVVSPSLSPFSRVKMKDSGNKAEFNKTFNCLFCLQIEILSTLIINGLNVSRELQAEVYQDLGE